MKRLQASKRARLQRKKSKVLKGVEVKQMRTTKGR